MWLLLGAGLPPLPSASATEFASEDGVELDQPLLVDGVDVGSVLRSAQLQFETQAARIDEQQQRLEQLRWQRDAMRGNITKMEQLLEQQRNLLDAQAATLLHQRAAIDLLRERQQAACEAVGSAGARASLLEERLLWVEGEQRRLVAKGAQLRDDVSEHESLRSLHSSQMDNQLAPSVASHAAELTRLAAVDAALTAESTELAANATALVQQLDQTEADANALTARVDAAENEASASAGRMDVVNAAADGRLQTRNLHASELSMLDVLTQSHDTTISSLEADASTQRSDVSALQSTAASLDASRSGAESSASGVEQRLRAAEELQSGSSHLVSKLEQLWSRSTLQAEQVRALEAALQQANATFQSRLSDEQRLSLSLSTRVANLESRASALELDAYNNVTALLGGIDYVTGLIVHFVTPKMYRFVFTKSSTWTVPVGVTSAFATLAGGGGTGFGWRYATRYHTGPSGGYLFSQPISLVPGETLSITVGKGGKRVSVATNGYSVVGPPYMVFIPPLDGDDGLSGWPGERRGAGAEETGGSAV